MSDQAFDALKTFDWGTEPKVLSAIDEAIVASHGDPEKRNALEKRLIAVLESNAPRAAKDFACRKLRTIGTAEAVPALSKLLVDEDHSHMARYALQTIPGAEATHALVEALAEEGPSDLRIGAASSLGVRRAEAAVAHLVTMLADKNPDVARSGALALGTIGSKKATDALAAAQVTASTKTVIADGLLDYAEKLLAAGDKAAAKSIYEKVLSSDHSKAAKSAASLGIKNC